VQKIIDRTAHHGADFCGLRLISLAGAAHGAFRRFGAHRVIGPSKLATASTACSRSSPEWIRHGLPPADGSVLADDLPLPGN
jgi:hypothetical protein